MNKSIHTTRDELTRTVEAAVAHAFKDVGIYAHDNDAVLARRRDFEFLHDLRTTSESAKSKIGFLILVGAAGGMISMFINGFKLWTRQ